MSKKVLLSVAAVALLATTAFAGDYKYENWPTATYVKTSVGEREVPTLIEVIDVWIHIPYYVIVDPQPLKIDLEQVGNIGDEKFHFRGEALGYTGKKWVKPTIHANFDADLTTKVVTNDDGKALSTPDKTKWTCGVSPSSITKTVPTELTIFCDVTHVDLLAFHQCQNLKVAEVLLYIMHQ